MHLTGVSIRFIPASYSIRSQRIEMSKIDIQKEYWDGVAKKKTFTHPICMNVFRESVSAGEAILDYGCGYGRTCHQLVECGYCNVVGIDISSQMIAHGKALNPSLELLHFHGKTIPFPDESFPACTLLAVLTCIPTDAGQTRVINEIHRVLCPGGLLYVSEYPIQKDPRNQKRYLQYEDEFGIYGVFRLSDGGVVRHHEMSWVYRLLSAFTVIWEDKIKVCTMNGNATEVFQMVAKKGEIG